jgi:hypothetical protein
MLPNSPSGTHNKATFTLQSPGKATAAHDVTPENSTVTSLELPRKQHSEHY